MGGLREKFGGSGRGWRTRASDWMSGDGCWSVKWDH